MKRNQVDYIFNGETCLKEKKQLELLKKNQNSNNQPAKQEIQQKLAGIQAKQQQVQSKLDQKKQIQQTTIEQQKVNKDSTGSKEKETLARGRLLLPLQRWRASHHATNP